MFQGIQELLHARGRTALITVTVGLIAVMVTFLSSLTAGLAHQSVSALQELTGDRTVVLADTGTTTLSASQLEPGSVDGQPLYQQRDRLDEDTIMIMNSPDVEAGTVSLNGDLAESTNTDSVSLGDSSFAVAEETNNLYLDHQPVALISTEDAAQMIPAPSAYLTDEPVDVDGTVSLTGSERWEASASYAGEQMSLNMMITMLYLISALVLGAFFTVWTIQRLRGIAISRALGAAQRVLVADALVQAVIVLAVGVTAGTALTVGLTALLPDALPVVVDASTTLVPALILAAAGLIGAATSLRPVLSVEPRAAMANA